MTNPIVDAIIDRSKTLASPDALGSAVHSIKRFSFEYRNPYNKEKWARHFKFITNASPDSSSNGTTGAKKHKRLD